MSPARPHVRALKSATILLLVLAVILAGCAGASRKPAASPPPAGDAESGISTSPESMAAPAAAGPSRESTAPPAEAAPTSPATASEGSSGGRQAALRAARSDFDRARRELAEAGADCPGACRALASLERAAGHLCELATDPDDRPRCEDARSRVLDARARVRASCTMCPNGPSLDRNAAIPSR